MGKKKSSSKSKEVLVDEEVSLSIIENQEFITMRVAEKLWSIPTTTKDQLLELVSDGHIQEKDFADWKIIGQHRVPTPGPSEIVLFISFVRAGLCLPTSSFLHRFLHYFDISLNHLTPNVVLHLSVYVHLCEAFLGIVPSISLFRFFFHLKSHPRSDNTSLLDGCGIQFRQGKKILFFYYDLVDSIQDWRSEWFYATNLIPPLVVHFGSGPTVNDRWEKNPLTSDELPAIKSLL
jgi:hypothetical protein